MTGTAQTSPKTNFGIDETWRPVVGFPGYVVSDQGRVGSDKRKTRPILKVQKNAYGYAVVNLHKDGSRFHRRVARLVLEAFVGPCPEGCEAAHLNGTRMDSRLCNLVWATAKVNASHRRLHGTATVGEKCGTAKLTWEKVRAIRHRREQGATLSQLSNDFNVAIPTIQTVTSGHHWKEEDDPNNPAARL